MKNKKLSFSFTKGNLQCRSCNEFLLSDGFHNRGEIIKRISNESSFTIAAWQNSTEGFYLYFIGSRPLTERINRNNFWQLVKLGQKKLDEFSHR